MRLRHCEIVVFARPVACRFAAGSLIRRNGGASFGIPRRNLVTNGLRFDARDGEPNVAAIVTPAAALHFRGMAVLDACEECVNLIG